MTTSIPAFRVTMDDFKASISEEHESKITMSSFTADYEDLFRVGVGKVEISDDMFGKMISDDDFILATYD